MELPTSTQPAPTGAVPKRLISVVVVTWNTVGLARACLKSITTAFAQDPCEIIVVDNGSIDGTAAMIEAEFPARLIANAENTGFAHACNQGLAAAAGDFVLVLNPDAALTRSALSALRAVLEQDPKVGAVGAQLVNEDGSRQNSFDACPTLATELLNKSLLRLCFPRRFPSKRQAARAPLEVESLIGACMMVRREVIERTGGLDERFFFFLEETDWCLRMRRLGYRVLLAPQAEVLHWQGQSKKHAPELAWIEYYRSMYRFFGKHHRPGVAMAFGALRAMKLGVNLAGTALLCLATLGLASGVRRRLRIYRALAAWHLAGCPDSVGLRHAQPSLSTPRHPPPTRKTAEVS